MKCLALLLFIATSAFAASPSSVNNDDSCDVKVGPAATLLLPYFEVDLRDPLTGGSGQTTLFTIVNVTRYPQIAHVTLWTDHAYPVMAFNLNLGGYGMQIIDMADILVRGFIVSPSGVIPTTPPGLLSASTNPNLRSPPNCANFPSTVPESILGPVRDALTKGVLTSQPGGSCNDIGNVHANAIGYATIDVVASCTSRLPTDPLYYTNDLLFDNVLIGDYEQIAPHPVGEPSVSDAGANPLVHIRAAPEGGGAGSNVETALPYTFYDRYTPASNRTVDRRHPLPSTFAARFIQGGPAALRTNLNIWREGFGSGSCTDARTSETMAVADVVRFDEHENPLSLANAPPCDTCPSLPLRLPAASLTSSSDYSYPAMTSNDVGGWLYLNLNNGGSTTYSVTHGGVSSLAPNGSTTTIGPRPSQNWVTMTMFGAFDGTHRMAAEFDAASLSNGCSPAAFPSSAAPIGAGGVFVCPPGTTLTNGSTAQCMNTIVNPVPTDAAAQRRRAARSTEPPPSINNNDSCDIKVGPAATLLLPYFEVDVSGTSGQTTLFTVTNVTPHPQIAHVTLWTDWAYPVLTFNLYLTGYGVQGINLADVLNRGAIAPSNGTSSATIAGSLSAASGNLRTSLDCANNPGVIPDSVIKAVRDALTLGIAPAGTSSCKTGVGIPHSNAIGYATIDVVASCTTRSPADPLYYTNDLLFDNALIGDYQQLGPHPAGSLASAFDAAGNPMVHIRAVPEGGGAGSNVATGLPYTFYDRYTPTTTRTVDRRQPLPSTFAARFIQGGRNALATNLTIWREAFGSGNCAAALQSSAIIVSEIVRFDEHENPFVLAYCEFEGCYRSLTLPAASSNSTADSRFPILSNADIGGWFYLNLNNGGSAGYSVTHDVGGQPIPTNARTNLAPIGSTTTVGPRPSQNWVTVTMFGNAGPNRPPGEFDAAPLGNGCSPAAFTTFANAGTTAPPIGPAGDVFVCPPGTTLTNGTTTQCKGTNVNPPP
jgi:hypothetical protein